MSTFCQSTKQIAHIIENILNKNTKEIYAGITLSLTAAWLEQSSGPSALLQGWPCWTVPPAVSTTTYARSGGQAREHLFLVWPHWGAIQIHGPEPGWDVPPKTTAQTWCGLLGQGVVNIQQRASVKARPLLAAVNGEHCLPFKAVIHCRQFLKILFIHF